MKRIMLFFAAFLLLLCGCNSAPTTKTVYAMGTVMTAELYGGSEALLNEAFAEVEALEKITSAKLNESELSALNRNGGGKMSATLSEIIEKSLYYAKLTGGAFDPTLGKIINLWAIGTDNARIPTEAELSPLKGLKSYQNIKISDNNISFDNTLSALDLGAIVKGFAGDRMKEMLTESGVKSAILDLGGSITLIGDKNGSPWRVGITDPSNTGRVIAKLMLKDKSVVTSGDYERFLEVDGVRYHHIIDGETAYPADSGLRSATIIADSAANADALSTACFVLGKDKALELIESIQGTECVLITEALEIITSSGIDSNNFEVLNEK